MRNLLAKILDQAGFAKLAVEYPDPVIDQEGDRGTGGIAAEPRTIRERSNRRDSNTVGELMKATRSKNTDREKMFGAGRGRLANTEPDEKIDVSSSMNWEQ